VAAATFAVATAAVASSAGRETRRIGLVLEQPTVSRAGDPYQYDAFRGLEQASRQLHIGAKAVVPNPSSAGPYTRDPLASYDYLAPLSYLAEKNYSMVIKLGGADPFAVSSAAHSFPNVKFVLLDGLRSWTVCPSCRAPTNIEGTLFHTEQPAYLAGFLAARMAERQSTHPVVSSVAGFKFLSTVVAAVAGFQAGAKAADPGIKLLNVYTNTVLPGPTCAHAAQKEIGNGSRVVFDVAGACGIGALTTASKSGVYGIGVDIDQSSISKKFILTSVVKNLDVAELDLARQLIHGQLPTGGNLSFNLRNDGVSLVGLGGLGKFSPDVPRGLRTRLTQLAVQIKKGKIRVPTTLNGAH
jgi:basic membrane protein A